MVSQSTAHTSDPRGWSAARVSCARSASSGSSSRRKSIASCQSFFPYVTFCPIFWYPVRSGECRGSDEEGTQVVEHPLSCCHNTASTFIEADARARCKQCDSMCSLPLPSSGAFDSAILHFSSSGSAKNRRAASCMPSRSRSGTLQTQRACTSMS